jgi:hypothetical protein
MQATRALAAEEAPKTDPRYPFRTDFANANLPWYQPKPLEFPPHHSDRRIGGELVSVDFIHRKGQFRATKTGELMDFTMPPYAYVSYLNAEADLRDVPLGTFFLFFLNQDQAGGFTRLATMQEQFTMDASHSFTYRLDEVKLGEGKLLTTKQSLSKNQPDVGKKELLVKPETRVWKDDQQVKLADLAAGDELLFNVTGKTADNPGWCTDIWVGAATHKLATAQQAKKFAEFTKRRGIAGWIDKTEGNLVTVTLFSGDARNFKQTWMGDFAVGKSGKLCVANDELRTWNPPVDGEAFSITEVRSLPPDNYGCSGVQVVGKVNNMLEGFRRGRVVRVFGAGWKTQDQFYGESLMGYGFGRMQNQELVENVAKEYPEQFPFRTDYGNAHMSWYRLQDDVKPPPFSEHLVFGELLQADVKTGSGQFRAERTGEVVNFNLIQKHTIKHLGKDTQFGKLPLGVRYRFACYQDDKGAFTRVTFISDDFSHLMANANTARIAAIHGDRLEVAWQLPEVKDYNGDMQRPPDIGRSELRVSDATRVWKGDQQVKLADLVVDDVLLMNVTSEQSGAPSVCTDLWIGPETHNLVSGQKPKTANK